MSLGDVKRRMADGSVKTYSYHRITDLERARAWLEKAPLMAVPTGKAHAVRWQGKTPKHTVSFHDQVVRRLIGEGFAVCLGRFVEKKGVIR